MVIVFPFPFLSYFLERETRVKITSRCLSQKLTMPDAGEDVERQELPPTAGGDAHRWGPSDRWFGSFLRGEIYSHHMIQLSRCLVFTKIKTCARMFMAPLITNAKAWKQQRCPSLDESINKLLYSHNKILFSAKKRKKLKRCEDKGSKLKSKILSERSHLKRLQTV